MDGVKKRNVLHSPHLEEIKKKKRRGAKNKALFFLICLVALFAIFVFVSRIEALNISEIEITGNKILEKDDLVKNVQTSIEGHYLWLIPKTNFLLYPKSKIKQNLNEKFKRLKNISISLKNTKTLEIALEERGIEYTYCGEDLKAENQECFFLDQNGYIFDEAPSFSDGVYFKFFGKVADGSQSFIGAHFMDTDTFKALTSFLDKADQMELHPSSLLLNQENDLEIYLGNTEKGDVPKIVLPSKADFKKLTEVLQTAVSTEPLKGNLKNKFNELLYIDLRFGNKVYYKFK